MSLPFHSNHPGSLIAMTPKLFLIAAAVLAGLAPAHAAVPAETEAPPPASIGAADALIDSRIDGMKALPITGLQMVKAGGRTFFLSNNGRFVLTGTLIDVWNRVAVAELEDVDRIANRIDLANMVFRSLHYAAGPCLYGETRFMVAFLAANAKLLGIIKRSRAKPKNLGETLTLAKKS